MLFQSKSQQHSSTDATVGFKLNAWLVQEPQWHFGHVKCNNATDVDRDGLKQDEPYQQMFRLMWLTLLQVISALYAVQCSALLLCLCHHFRMLQGRNLVNQCLAANLCGLVLGHSYKLLLD